MNIWIQKKFYILRSLLAVFVISVVVFTSSINGLCAETTPSANDDWTMTIERFLDLTFDEFSKIVSLNYVTWKNLVNYNIDTYKNFLQTTLPDIYEYIYGTDKDNHVVHGHGGGGHSRDSDKIDYSKEIDVPVEVSNSVVQYVQYYVTEVAPTSYKECFLASYNFLNADLFNNFAQFSAVKNFIKNQNGYVLTYAMYTAGSYTIYACVIPKSMDVGFYGTTTQGIFNNVSVAINWQVSQTPWLIFNEVDLYSINPDGSTIKWTSGYYPSVAGLQNLTNIPTSGQRWNVFSNTSKSELIYVFDTLNAYKNYNAGVPQPYYLTQAGSDTPTWTVGSGTINTGEMRNVGNVYNEIVNNTQTGMTPEEVQKLIETILDKFIKNGGSVGGDNNDDDDDDSSIWDTIAKGVKSLVSGVAKVIQGLIDGILNAILGEEDANGERHGGLLGSITSLINSVLTFFTDTNGTVFTFLSAFIGWLPADIVNVLKSLFIIAVMFALIKLVREAF